MISVPFDGANLSFTAPEGLSESQVQTAPGYETIIQGGSLDGLPMSVVCWKPDVEEMKKIVESGVIFISFVGRPTPHFLSTTFEEAKTVA